MRCPPCHTMLRSLRCSLGLVPPLPRRAAGRQAEPRRASQAVTARPGSLPGREADASPSPPHLEEHHQARQQGQAVAPAGGALEAAPAAAAAQCGTTAAVGQVMAAQANFVRVRVDSLEGGAPGEAPPRARLLCVVRALLKKMRREVLVGDRVRLVGIDWADGRGMVEDVLPRGSQLREPAVANVDHVLLVFSGALPAFQPSPATRYLLSADAAGLPVTVAINKADLMAEAEAAALVQQIGGWGYRALAVSVVSGQGLGELEAALRGRVSVVAGPSGAGKSSIINALRLRSAGLEAGLDAMAAQPSGAGGPDSEGEEQEEEETGEGHDAPQRDGADAQQAGAAAAAGSQSRQDVLQPGRPQLELQAVGGVSERIGRGKHTTRNVTLLELGGGGGGDGGGGLVVDTPGFNQPDLAGIPAAQLGQHFPEVQRLLQEDRCAFRGCQHLQEPGCVVREAGWERYPLYCEIHAELKALEEVALARQLSKKRREGTVRVKSRAGGQQGVEARLETKSHRRVSRRSVRQKLSELAKDVEDDELL